MRGIVLVRLMTWATVPSKFQIWMFPSEEPEAMYRCPVVLGGEKWTRIKVCRTEWPRYVITEQSSGCCWNPVSSCERKNLSIGGVFWYDKRSTGVHTWFFVDSTTIIPVTYRDIQSIHDLELVTANHPSQIPKLCTLIFSVTDNVPTVAFSADIRETFRVPDEYSKSTQRTCFRSAARRNWFCRGAFRGIQGERTDPAGSAAWSDLRSQTLINVSSDPDTRMLGSDLSAKQTWKKRNWSAV